METTFFWKPLFLGDYTLYNQNCERLLTIGDESIIISKKSLSQYCSCDQKSFCMNGLGNVFVSNSNMMKPFQLKRLQVIQLYETEEQKQRRKQEEKEEKEKRNKQIEKECNLMKEDNNYIMSQLKNQINQIEEWCGLKAKQIIFDSDICEWDVVTSTFDAHIMNKPNIAILIKHEKGFYYGGFMYHPIDKYEYFNEEKQKYEIAIQK